MIFWVYHFEFIIRKLLKHAGINILYRVVVKHESHSQGQIPVVYKCYKRLLGHAAYLLHLGQPARYFIMDVLHFGLGYCIIFKIHHIKKM